MVATKEQMGGHRHTLPRDYALHGWQAMVLGVEALQEAEQARRSRAEPGAATDKQPASILESV